MAGASRVRPGPGELKEHADRSARLINPAADNSTLLSVTTQTCRDSSATAWRRRPPPPVDLLPQACDQHGLRPPTVRLTGVGGSDSRGAAPLVPGGHGQKHVPDRKPPARMDPRGAGRYLTVAARSASPGRTYEAGVIVSGPVKPDDAGTTPSCWRG